MIKRRSDWPQRLEAFFAAAAERRFSWRRFNCCLFAGAGIKAMTGTNPAGLFPAAGITNKRSAAVALKKFAGGGVLATAKKIAAAFGMPEIAVKLAGRGDVVLVEVEAGDALGLVGLSGVEAVFLHPEDGLCRVPIDSCKRAWRVE